MTNTAENRFFAHFHRTSVSAAKYGPQRGIRVGAESHAPGLPHHRYLNRHARHHVTPAGWCLIACLGFWVAAILLLHFG